MRCISNPRGVVSRRSISSSDGRATADDGGGGCCSLDPMATSLLTNTAHHNIYYVVRFLRVAERQGGREGRCMRCRPSSLHVEAYRLCAEGAKPLTLWNLDLNLSMQSVCQCD